MRILGIDYGSARVGVALGDTETRVASPWRIIANESDEDVVERLLDLARIEKVTRFVVGIPRPLADQNRETDQAKRIREFIEVLKKSGIETLEADETLTSKVAADQVKEMGGKGKRDDLAAAAILQNYLDGLPA
jgi:putative Holliday junction resolvase